MNYAYNPDPKKSVKVYGRNLRISRKSSVTVCKKLTGMHLGKGKNFLMRMMSGKESMNGKYYTNVVKEMADLLVSAENNAEFRGLDQDKLLIHASAHKGFTHRRPRKFKSRGQVMKVTNVQVVLEQR